MNVKYYRKCPWCDWNYFRGINNHIKSHNKTIEDYLMKINNLSEWPTCKFCGKPVSSAHYIINNTCGNKSCIMKYQSSIGSNPLLSKNRKKDENGRDLILLKQLKNGTFPFLSKNLKRDENGICIHQRDAGLITADGYYEKTHAYFGPSMPELRVGTLLNELNINNIPQYKNIKVWHRMYAADFYLPDFNLIIEVDGDYKYKSGKLDNYYVERDKIIKSTSGIDTLRIRVGVARTISKEDLLKLINDFITSTTNEK